MELHDVWQAATLIRDDDNDDIVAVQVPIEAWRFLIDRVQEMEDREAARRNLARLRDQQRSSD